MREGARQTPYDKTNCREGNCTIVLLLKQEDIIIERVMEK